jgi:predicted nucleic acid-binding protein
VIVVSDTSPLHCLILCDAQELVPQLFAQVVIPPTVFQELQHPHAPPLVRDWATGSLPAWIRIQAPSHLDSSLNLDLGETPANQCPA